MSNTHRAQYFVPALIVLLLAGTVTYMSFTREPVEAFLFPRLIAVVMFTLAIWNFVRAARGVSRVGDGLSLKSMLTIAPGIAVLAGYVFSAEHLGFYVTSTIAFFLLFSLYDPASHTHMRSWVRRFIITVLFMLVIYALFTLLLKVQTPRGILL